MAPVSSARCGPDFGTDPASTQRIRGPAELLQAVPYLLGFHPEASLVLVGLHRGLLIVTARLDLADLRVPGLLADTVGALAEGGSSALVGVVWASGDDDDERDAWAGLAGDLDLMTDRADCVLLDLLVVAGHRWWSTLCDGIECCPPGGTPLPDAPSAFAAAATVAGIVPLPDRAALESSLDADPAAQTVTSTAIGHHENAWMAASLDGGRARREAVAVRELIELARASQRPGWPAPDADEIARLAAALVEPAVRDQLWLAADARRVDGRPLWRELARRVPDPYRAPPLLLFGWVSWRAGDGALAGIAAQRAIDSDPGYTAADLLLATVNQCIDPRTTPTLGDGPRGGGGVSRRRGRRRGR